VVHACNPSDSGGRDQEDCVQGQPRQIVHETLSQKNSSQKRAGGVAQGVGPEFKPQYNKRKRKVKRACALRGVSLYHPNQIQQELGFPRRLAAHPNSEAHV
jgi:hypothetical protein